MGPKKGSSYPTRDDGDPDRDERTLPVDRDTQLDADATECVAPPPSAPAPRWISEDDPESDWIIDCERPTRAVTPGPTRPVPSSASPQSKTESESRGGIHAPLPEHRYRIHSELGRGGMGVVVAGEDLTLSREVAIKVMRERSAQDPSQVARFLEEARIQSRLDHPNICPVHEMGFDAQGRPYFTMKRVRGQPLSQLLPSGPVDHLERLTELLRIFVKVCNGIALAHDRGVVHRDLKPANIMVGEFGEVLVMDWGLARALTQGTSEPTGMATSASPNLRSMRSLDGDILGTPAYMAPEQARGEISKVGIPADIYALGGILYRILSGHPPHRGDNSASTLENAKRGHVPPLPSVAHHLLPFVRELEAVARKAMAATPDQRYASVPELERDIEAFLDGRALSAVHYSPAALLRKWMKRHRKVLYAASSVAVVAAASFLGWSLHRAGVQQRELQDRVAIHGVEAESLRAQGAAEDAVLDKDHLYGADHWRHANGELNTAEVNRWYDTLSEAVAVRESLIQLGERAPTQAARAAMDLPAIRDEAIDLCLKGALRACEFGHHGFARGWVDRARSLGLPAARVAEERGRVEDSLRSRIEADLAMAKQLLKEAQSSGNGAAFLDSATTDLVRRKSPDLVRLLLRKEHVRGGHAGERRLAVEALGRIGDAQTKGPEGRDAVEELLGQLADVDPDAQLNEALGIARALGFLGDSRAHEGLHDKRKASGWLSLFSRESALAYRRIPLPAHLLPKEAADGQDPDVFVDRGIRMMDQGDLPSAIEQFSQALRIDPTHEDALVNRGICHLQSNDAAAAVADHSKAIERRPDAYNALHNRGNAYSSLRQFELAIQDYSECLRLKPDYVHAFQGRAVAHRHLGNLPQAIADYTHALKLDPKNASIYNNRGIARSDINDIDGALEDYGAAIRLAPETTSAWMNRGYLLARTGKPKEGLADLDRAVERFPESGQVYLIRGIVYANHLNNLEQALADLTLAVTKEPRRAVNYSERSQVYVKQENYRAALEDLDVAVSLIPNSPNYHERRGIVLYYLGRIDDAVAALTRATEVSPKYLDAWWNLASILQGAERYREAADAYADVIKLAPSHRDAHIRHGLMARHAGDNERALRAYDAALTQFGDDALFFGLRGDCHRGAGRLPEAIADFDRSISLDPKSASAFYGRGMTHVIRADRDRALADAAALRDLEGESARWAELREAAAAIHP